MRRPTKAARGFASGGPQSPVLRRLGALIVAIAAGIGLCAPDAHAAPQTAADSDPFAAPPAQPLKPGDAAPGAIPEDGPAYPITGFEFEYERPHPSLPPIEELLTLEVALGWTHQGYVAPRRGLPIVRIALGDAANRGRETYYGSALQRVLERVRDHLTERHHLIGVYVRPHPRDISDTGQDYRAPDDLTLTIFISTGFVSEVRTLASGDRVEGYAGPWGAEIDPLDRVNHQLHARIRARSAIQPAREGEPLSADLLRKDLLDRYLFHLSRHPGRRVEAALSPGDEPGAVILDYHVTENRPLVLYAQLSNTGTRSTGYLRERFGLFHTQLTNRDDILSLDYSTSNFDSSHALSAAYEAPFSNDRIRWRVLGGWNQFTADEVGAFDQDFEGESWSVGGEIIANILQRRELFLDLVGGLRFENIQVTDQGVAIEGDEDFFVPSIALVLEQATEWFNTEGSVALEWWLSNADEAGLAALGRTAPDENPVVLRWSLGHSVYLEPLLNPATWLDPTKPGGSTLAHELAMSLRGQHAFGNRLIPQAQQVVGGLYSVRGYPESIVAGDDAIIGTIEYRLHVPRLFQIEREPRLLFGRDFRFAPQYVFGTPDWDLILKGFVDAGRTWNSDRLSFEDDETLIGAGIGFDLLYRRNLQMRVDWGFALEDLESANVHEGSNRVHFVVTILF